MNIHTYTRPLPSRTHNPDVSGVLVVCFVTHTISDRSRTVRNETGIYGNNVNYVHGLFSFHSVR